jgi:hypothetical protein
MIKLNWKLLLLTLSTASGFLSASLVAQEKIELMRISEPSSEELGLLPKNLARWHLGVRMLIPGEDEYQVLTAESHALSPLGKFLDDDETEVVELDAGSHDLVVDLGDFLSVSRFFCMSFSASGRVSLFGSLNLMDIDSDGWVPLGRTLPFTAESTVDLRFPLMDVRFLRVRFDIEEPGGLGSLGAMGLLSASDMEFVGVASAKSAESDQGTASAAQEQEAAEGMKLEAEEAAELAFTEHASGSLRYDYGKLYSGSRVTYLSSGDPRLANFLIDDDILTYYDIPPEETSAVFVIQLPPGSQVDYVSMVMESGDSELELWFLNDLPEELEAGFELQDSEMARFWKNPGSQEPLLFASNDPQSVRTAMQFAQTSDFRLVEISPEVITDFGDPIKARVRLGENRVQIPVPLSEANFLVFRWTSTSPIPMGVRIFEISVIGQVEPVDGRMVAYSEAPAAAASEIAALEAVTPPNQPTLPPIEIPGGPNTPGTPPNIPVITP